GPRRRSEDRPPSPASPRSLAARARGRPPAGPEWPSRSHSRDVAGGGGESVYSFYMTEAERAFAALHLRARVALAIAILVFVGVAEEAGFAGPEIPARALAVGVGLA